ncbi:protein FAR1-RELATED SEQUENCE 4-like [Raphanus sativus]|uniref:Protein FAR1-RELATED SEQUENCE 4-like n=1 Tax=Raphanus sativus TaxID=3726 RepID=A0A9W3CKL4_RAPSA|nr:protein FAR1-RELATED SEQUENCE 4-like [Raphanus sativus]
MKDGADTKWISGDGEGEDEIHTIVLKKPVEEVTYSVLVERICRKIKVDEYKMIVKISYFPMVMYSNKPSYICDDEEVFGYLMQVNQENCRSVLHVELSQTDDHTDFYGGLSDRETTEREATDREVTDREAIDTEAIGTEATDTEAIDTEAVDEDGTEMGATDNEGTGGMLTLYENIEMHENVTEREAGPSVEVSQVVYKERDDGMDLVIGQEFRTKEEAQTHIQKASHLKCFEYEVIKSDSKRYVIKCRGEKEGCKWRVRVAKLTNSDRWTVRTYIKQHRCSVVTTRTLPNRRRGTQEIVASVLAQDYPGSFDTPRPKALMDLVHRRVAVQVSYTTAYRGKRLAANKVRGTPEESYSLLYCYMHVLEQVNPDTITRVVVDEGKKFKYLFWALGASIEGFRAMRKVLVVDATHLKTVYGGVLFIATAQDPNHHHYPIAFGVADGEKYESWLWFMEQLKSVISDVPRLVFLSDRNKGLIKAVRLVFPQAAHGYCIWHLSQNVKGYVRNNKDTCAFKFMECAHAYTEAEFLALYDTFCMRYPSAAEYLKKSCEQKKWARCYFEGVRYNVDTTNSAESFNGVIKDARKLTLLPMFDFIIGKIAEWFNKHRKEAAEQPPALKLVPIVEEEMSKRCIDAGVLTVDELNSFHLEYSVHGSDGKRYTVDMAMKTCTCEQFDKDKYPCVHAAAAATFMTEKAGRELHLSEYCSQYYLVEQWALAYHRTIYPVPHMSDWVIPEEVKAKKVLPPEFEVKKGKPQETRYPSAGEARGRGKRGRGSGRGTGTCTGRARGGGMGAYFECGSGSGSGV